MVASSRSCSITENLGEMNLTDLISRFEFSISNLAHFKSHPRNWCLGRYVDASPAPRQQLARGGLLVRSPGLFGV